jgi:hypothetical protein
MHQSSYNNQLDDFLLGFGAAQSRRYVHIFIKIRGLTNNETLLTSSAVLNFILNCSGLFQSSFFLQLYTNSSVVSNCGNISTSNSASCLERRLWPSESLPLFQNMIPWDDSLSHIELWHTIHTKFHEFLSGRSLVIKFVQKDMSCKQIGKGWVWLG